MSTHYELGVTRFFDPIPILPDEDVVFEPEVDPSEYEPTLPVPPRPLPRRSWGRWLAVLVFAALSGAGGWYVGLHPLRSSVPHPAIQPTVIAPRAPVAVGETASPPSIQTAAVTPAQPTSQPTHKHRKPTASEPTEDPLTL